MSTVIVARFVENFNLMSHCDLSTPLLLALLENEEQQISSYSPKDIKKLKLLLDYYTKGKLKVVTNLFIKKKKSCHKFWANGIMGLELTLQIWNKKEKVNPIAIGR